MERFKKYLENELKEAHQNVEDAETCNMPEVAMRELFVEAELRQVLAEFNKLDMNRVLALEFLKRLKRAGYEWITRNKNETLCASIEKPLKFEINWLTYCGFVINEFYNFPEVQWKDEEPVHINDLIKIYEKE